MKDYVIVSDSCCDLEKPLRDKYSIEYIPMSFSIGEKSFPASRLGTNFRQAVLRYYTRRNENNNFANYFSAVLRLIQAFFGRR